MRWRLNLLSLDDTISFSLGVAPGRERTLLLVAAVAVTAAVVSVAGMVGWVGLDGAAPGAALVWRQCALHHHRIDADWRHLCHAQRHDRPHPF